MLEARLYTQRDTIVFRGSGDNKNRHAGPLPSRFETCDTFFENRGDWGL